MGNIKNKFNISFIENIKSLFFLSGLLLAFLVWLIDPLIDAVILGEGTISDRLFHPDTHETYMRLVISLTIIIYSFIASVLLNKSIKLNTALEDSERSLQLFVDNAPSAIALFDKEMRYLAYSRRYLDDFDLGKQKLIGRSHYDIFPEAPDHWKEIHQRCLAGAIEICDEDSFVRVNGKLEWTKWEIHPWYKKKEEIGGIIFFCEVITKNKEIENEKNITFELLQNVINASQDYIFVKDKDLRTILCNNSFAAALNKKPKDLYGKTDIENGWDEEFVYGNPEKGIRGYENDDKDVLAGNTLTIESESAIIKDEIRYFETIKSPLLDENNNVTAILAIARDITERKRSRQVLQESEQRYRALVEATTSIIWTTNESGDFIEPQTSWEKYTGQTWEEHKGSGWTKAIHPDDLNHIASGWQSAIEKKVAHHDSGRMWNKDLNEWRDFEVSAVPIENQDGSIREWVGIVTDITARKKAEAKYRTLVESSPYCVHQIDINKNIISMNKAGLNMLNLDTESDIINTPYIDCVRQEDKKWISEIIDAVFDGDSREYEFSTNSGLVFKSILVPVYDQKNNVNRLLGITQDITETKRAERKLNYQASHDNLTGLINRQEFERRAEGLLSTINIDQEEHVLCFMDLDQFKVVNDTCGHIAGDEMLRQLSSILNTAVRKRDTLARLGGDEFGVLMEHCSIEDAHRVASSIQNAIQDYQFSWEERIFKVSVSIGLVAFNETTPNFTELLKNADAACYLSKEAGRNRIHIYNAEDRESVKRQGEMQWVERINRALEQERFILYAQPIESFSSNSRKHFEFLIRMIDESGETVAPGAFLPAAERYNLMSRIDKWVINNTFKLINENTVSINDIEFFSINISGQSITDPEILKLIIKKLDESNINGNKFCFEITETAAISNLSTALKFINSLKAKGCRFALDDFGSGLSSFGYLKKLPVDYLKIDGMFVKDIVDDPIDHAMVKSINEIGHVMGMKTIAEFVENDMIKGMLKEIGVDYVQGYGVGKPEPLEKS
jgi:diguanylate cyclase (GGDEF)-like protein/PAS domain S-box-containing protein